LAAARRAGLLRWRQILMIGGSGGARTLNESVMQNIEVISSSEAQLVWQSGKYYYEAAKKSLEESGAGNIILQPFISEMNRAFQVADVIISRAGAGTISELCVIGKPVILVPSPNVAEDHQTRNAKSLTDEHAGILVPDKNAREELITTALQLLDDDPKKTLLSENIKKLALPDASERIAGEAIKLLKRT
jgi:UDP-N-acetylglucosamine--N-acetylmuramyl-(pentapeptide) pyrophosphoryl-undecaprenol N-acetylglucosamine transferase